MGIKFIDTEEVRSLMPYHCHPRDVARGPAWEAFQKGEEYHPRTYEYGTNAGDYSSPLVSTGSELWYYRVRQECATRRAVIAVREVA